MAKKGQIWTSDFIAGATGMAIIILIFILMWNGLANRWNTSNDYRRMQTDAVFASEALLNTPGEPNSWEVLQQINSSNISAIGLTYSRNEINRLKIQKIVAENSSAYGFIKNKLGLQLYEVGLRISDIRKNTTLYEFGSFPGLDNNSVAIDRIGTIDGNPVIMHLEVWK